MYPLLYQRRTRVRFLLCLPALALCLRLLCAPALRGLVWEKTKAVLGSEGLLKAVFLLETGTVPEIVSLSGVSTSGPPAEPETEVTACPTECAPPQEAETETAAPRETEAPSIPEFTPEEAEAIRFRGNCTYAVDKAALLLEPLNWPDEPGPRVLIMQSHTCEAYTQSEGHAYIPSENYRTLDPENNMIAVGDALTEALAALGVEVIHDRTLNDYPSYNRSYAVAREKIAAYLEEYPSIVMVIDLHRDALDQPVRETVERDGRTLAPLMLVVGTDEGGLSHPHWERNLSCGLKLQALGNRDAPSLFKALSFRQSRFNGDMTPGSLIVEVGSTENTLPEAAASMAYLAEYVSELLRCD
ncbi:MAG: stage II sporulation protein P [Oscillospiraceae bacterium]|nr:stage II sporulation protein P [Oscillospiraceae bacterium]